MFYVSTYPTVARASYFREISKLPLTVSYIIQSETSARDRPDYDYYHLNEVNGMEDKKNYMKRYIMELMSRQYLCLDPAPTSAVELSLDLGSHHE